MKKAKIWGGVLGLVVFGLGFYAFQEPAGTVEREVSSTLQPPLEQGETWGPAQDQISAQIIEETKKIIITNRGDSKITSRDAHPKAHGCVKAVWNFLNSDLRPEQRVGVFAETGPIPAWVRFSNGNPAGANSADSEADTRGMAIKLMTPQGNQDFIMITASRFFSRDAEDYLDIFRSLNAGGWAVAWYFARNPTNALLMNEARNEIDNVLTTTFSSPVPLKLGAQFMRVKAAPCEGNFARQPTVDRTHRNFLRESLVSSLKDGEACFEFFVQPNNDPKRNPLEDTTRKWNEKVSPFVRVARLDLLRQEGFDTPERLAFCENLSFNPWNSHPELRPMGQINRIRKTVYQAISEFRHQANGVPQIEPKDHEACVGMTAPLCVVRK